jgi:acyl-coenzyme A synthetase/AMP-(fatty) acid ligase
MRFEAELEHALALHPRTRPALVAEDEDAPRVVTYGELSDMVDRLRVQLAALGMAQGQVLPILARRTPEAVALAFAVLLEGGAFCFLHEKFRAEDRRWLVDKMSPIGTIVDPTGLALLGEEREAYRPIFLETPGAVSPAELPGLSCAKGLGAAARLPKRSGATISRGAAHVHFSSGSSGRPKGALGSREGLLHFAHTQIDAYRLTPADRLLCMLGFSNNLGLVQMFTALWSGAPLHLTHATHPPDLAARIRRAGITGLGGSTGLWTTALAAVPAGAPLFPGTPTLRYISTGGARMSVPVFQELAGRLGAGVAIHEIYGQAEIRQATSFHVNAPEHRARAGSVGRAVNGTELVIARDRDTLAATGETGEVVYLGPGKMLGYLGDDDGELSRSRLSTHGAFPGTAVVYTGDLGFLDADGYLTLVGRADRRIDISGHQVWPGDVEEVLARHPGVIEPIVFGVPDAQSGARVVAVVLAREGTSAVELRGQAARQLPPHMVPSSVAVWQSLPRTANGKPALAEIKARYLAQAEIQP